MQCGKNKISQCKKAVFGGVLILIAGIYFCPVTNYTFAETYQKEDEVSLSLKNSSIFITFAVIKKNLNEVF